MFLILKLIWEHFREFDDKYRGKKFSNFDSSGMNLTEFIFKII